MTGLKIWRDCRKKICALKLYYVTTVYIHTYRYTYGNINVCDTLTTVDYIELCCKTCMWRLRVEWKMNKRCEFVARTLLYVRVCVCVCVCLCVCLCVCVVTVCRSSLILTKVNNRFNETTSRVHITTQAWEPERLHTNTHPPCTTCFTVPLSDHLVICVFLMKHLINCILMRVSSQKPRLRIMSTSWFTCWTKVNCGEKILVFSPELKVE